LYGSSAKFICDQRFYQPSLQRHIFTFKSRSKHLQFSAFESSINSLSNASTMNHPDLLHPSQFQSAPVNPSSPLSSLPSPTPLPSSLPRPPRAARDYFAHQNDEPESETDGDSDIESDNANETRRDSAQATARKIQSILRAIRKRKWSLRQFLEMFIEETDSRGNEILVSSRKLRTPSQRREYLRDTLSSLNLHSAPIELSELLGEFGALRDTQYFGRFDSNMKLEDVDLEAAVGSIQETAPQWSAVLNELLQNERSHWGSYSTTPKDDSYSGRIFLITSIISSSQAKQRSNFLHSLLDIYLLGSGVKRRVFSTLSGLGICHSYETANRLMHKLSETAAVRK
jgi:hypothetical protein